MLNFSGLELLVSCAIQDSTIPTALSQDGQMLLQKCNLTNVTTTPETVDLSEEPENPEIQILESSADNEIEFLGIVFRASNYM